MAGSWEYSGQQLHAGDQCWFGQIFPNVSGVGRAAKNTFYCINSAANFVTRSDCVKGFQGWASSWESLGLQQREGEI